MPWLRRAVALRTRCKMRAKCVLEKTTETCGNKNIHSFPYYCVLKFILILGVRPVTRIIIAVCSNRISRSFSISVFIIIKKKKSKYTPDGEI